MLELRAVSVQYGKRPVLREVSLTIGAGEIVALVGANAAGKTTVLRTIMGLKELAAGAINFDGEDVTRLSTVERVRRGLALSPEGRQIFPKFSVHENLLMGGYHRADRNHLGGDIARVCKMFPRLAERRSQRAGSMSGGEQQMLAMGRALMGAPKLLMLDEPSLGLAPIIVADIFRTVGELRESGVSVLLVEQNAQAALQIADRAYVMELGEFILNGAAKEIATNTRVAASYLGFQHEGESAI